MCERMLPRIRSIWGLSQGGWIAPLAASCFPDAAFAIALSGGGLSSAEQELFDSEYELSKAGHNANEVNDALAFQKLKNEIIALPRQVGRVRQSSSYSQQKKFRHPGIDVRGPEKRDDPFWTHAALLCLRSGANVACFKGSDAGDIGRARYAEAVKANVRAIRQILDQAGRRGLHG
jgi:hypothetical protein